MENQVRFIDIMHYKVSVVHKNNSSQTSQNRPRRQGKYPKNLSRKTKKHSERLMSTWTVCCSVEQINMDHQHILFNVWRFMIIISNLPSDFTFKQVWFLWQEPRHILSLNWFDAWRVMWWVFSVRFYLVDKLLRWSVYLNMMQYTCISFLIKHSEKPYFKLWIQAATN